MDNFTDIKLESEKLLKNAEVVVVYNQAAFNNTRYDDGMISRYSTAWSRQFSASEPSWIQTMLVENQIDDEIDWFNLGGDFGEPKKFNSFEIGNQQLSGWTDFTKEYKFISLQINVSNTRIINQRDTKDLFQALGDFGGLLSIL